jgi:hypothetical protein
MKAAVASITPRFVLICDPIPDVVRSLSHKRLELSLSRGRPFEDNLP